MRIPAEEAKIYCSEELTQGLDKHIVCLSVINTVLAITAVVGNTVVLIALHRETSLHRPSKALLRNLVTGDLCVSFAELALVGTWISILQEQWRICLFFFYTQSMMANISISVSLYTLAAISIDRLLALLLGLRYRQVVTVRRVCVLVTVPWVLIGVGMVILTMLNPDVARIVAALGIAVCLMTSIASYNTIFIKLRNQRTQLHSSLPQQENQTISLNTSRYRKTVSTSLWLQMAVVCCYFPYMLLAPFAYEQIENKQSSTLYIQFYSAVTLMFSNSTLNPILYCWRIKEVRRAVKGLLRCLQM